MKNNEEKHFDKKEWQKALTEVRKNAENRHRNAVDKIILLAKEVDASRLLVAVYANIGFGPAEQFDDHLHGTIPVKLEILAYHLYPFFGFSDEKEISPFHTQNCTAVLDELFMAKQQHNTFSNIANGHLSTADFLVQSLRMHTETVRGSAFPEQTAEEISAIQGSFERWFSECVGIGPIRVIELLWAVIKTIEEVYNNSRAQIREHAEFYKNQWEEAKKKPNKDRTVEDKNLLTILKNAKTAWHFGYISYLNKIAPDVLPVGPHNIEFIDRKPSGSEWDALCNLIGLTEEKRRKMKEPIEVRQKPLFVLPDKSVILSDISNGLDVVWDTFERIAKTDAQFHDKRYQRRKAKWLEQKVAEYLKRIFSKEHIYSNLSYPDPNKADQNSAEMDVAIHWGPFLILIECKAKQFRMESQLGDFGRLFTDVKANLADAFEQARRALRYIDSAVHPRFIEISSGRRLSIKKENIRRIYLLTISQHHLAGLTNKLGDFREIGLFTEREFPLSLCVADLDTISQFCDGPDIFLHYIERRLDIQHQSAKVMSDELSLFGAYLETRLQAKRLWEQDGKPVTGFVLDGFDKKFQQWMIYKRGDEEKLPQIKLDVPVEIHEVLQELRKRTDDSARWISFSLLNMSDSGLASIASMFREIRKAKLIPGKFRRIVHQENDTVISITASIDVPEIQLRERVWLRATLEKYRCKAKKSIGIGIFLPDTSKPFDCATWIEGPWEYDKELENLIENEPLSVPVAGQKLPGRNEPCICGSGKKFKKCCLPKFEEARRKRLR
jgi:hypothetical protein